MAAAPGGVVCICSRAFSATGPRQSKLGRTPISIPPGVELLIGEPKVKRDPTTYLKIPRRTVSVEGPLGNGRHLFFLGGRRQPLF